MSPPSLCVESVRRTLFQPWTRMSGWWLAASAASATRSTNAIAAAKSASSKSRTIASPSRRQLRAASTSAAAMPRRRSAAHAPILVPMRIVSPRAPRHRAAVRARPRRRGRRRHARVRPSRRRRSTLPQVTRDVLPRRAVAPARSTRAVRERTEQRRGDLRARRASCCASCEPDLIVTQALCAVCAVSYDDVRARSPSGSTRARRSSRSTRTTLGETLGDVRTLAQATDAQRRRRRPRRTPARRASTACGSRCAGAPPVPRRGARVARPGLRRRPLDAAADRAAPAASTCSACRRALRAVARGRRSRPRSPRSWSCMPCGYDAARALRGGRRATPTSCARSARGASSRSTPPPTSRARARGWSTASSCSPTSCTPTASPRQRGVAPALDVRARRAGGRSATRRRR